MFRFMGGNYVTKRLQTVKMSGQSNKTIEEDEKFAECIRFHS